MTNPNTDQFDIEDIIREFGSAAPEEGLPAEEVAEEVTQEAAPEEVTEQTPGEAPEENLEEEYEIDFHLPQEFFEEPEPAILKMRWTPSVWMMWPIFRRPRRI